jgi:hypothetical protein
MFKVRVNIASTAYKSVSTKRRRVNGGPISGTSSPFLRAKSWAPLLLTYVSWPGNVWSALRSFIMKWYMCGNLARNNL